jgi:hypothetical protein
MTSGTLGHEYFEELCALSSVGQLSVPEYQELTEHLRDCAACRDAHRDLVQLTHSHLPRLAAYASEMLEMAGGFDGAASSDYKERFVAEAGARGLDLRAKTRERSGWSPWRFLLPPELSNATAALLCFAGLIAIAGILAYRWKGAETRTEELTAQVSELLNRNMELQKELHALSQRKQDTETDLRKTRGDSTNLAAQLEALHERIQKDDLAMQGLNAELSRANDREGKAEQRLREAEQRVRESEQTLLAVKSELTTLRASRSEEDGRGTAQSVEFAELSRQVKEQEEVIDKQQKLLSVDQDVRNLMAARNLHITDIFDVDGKGKRKSAFGRVFYTEGKSLIFYAFDLEGPKVLSAKHSFQAWGQLADSSTSTINLGIFYVDDPAQKRWMLRFDNPAVLDKISALFVTVEPHGGTARPTGQKLMYAYLGHAPNHP